LVYLRPSPVGSGLRKCEARPVLRPGGLGGLPTWAILSTDSVGLSRESSQFTSKTSSFAPKTAYSGAKLAVLAGRVSPTGFWAGRADRANPDRRARALLFHSPAGPAGPTRPSQSVSTRPISRPNVKTCEGRTNRMESILSLKNSR
jgi:hypothetical protein